MTNRKKYDDEKISLECLNYRERKNEKKSNKKTLLMDFGGGRNTITNIQNNMKKNESFNFHKV